MPRDMINCRLKSAQGRIIALFSFLFSLFLFIKDVVTSLREKLYLNAEEHFSLVLEHLKSAKRNKLTLLDPDETVARVKKR